MRRLPRPLAPALFALLVLAGVAGCAPSIAPLYRDYRIGLTATADDAEALRARVRTALAEAGWTPAEGLVPGVVATQPRPMGQGLFSRTEVTLDVTPIGGQHVRVFFHPYRRYVTGGRSKVGFLGDGLRRRLVPPLNEALARQGLVALDTPRERDEEAANGD